MSCICDDVIYKIYLGGFQKFEMRRVILCLGCEQSRIIVDKFNFIQNSCHCLLLNRMEICYAMQLPFFNYLRQR